MDAPSAGNDPVSTLHIAGESWACEPDLFHGEDRHSGVDGR